MTQPGDHITFVSTTDKYTRLRTGDTGVVTSVDDLGTVHVAWDPDGHALGLVPGVDVWRPLHPRWGGEHAPMHETKLCPHCREQKPVGEFARRRRNGETRQSWCRACIADTNRDRRMESK
jgi:hypothetical protein